MQCCFSGLLHCLLDRALIDFRGTMFRAVLTISIVSGGELSAGPHPALADEHRLTDAGRSSSRTDDAARSAASKASEPAGGASRGWPSNPARVRSRGACTSSRSSEADRYSMLADENRINLRLLPPPRGRILDRFGVPLADNRQNYRLVIVAEQAGDIAATLDALGFADRDRRDRPPPGTARRPAQASLSCRSWFAPISSWEEMARIEVAIPELPGVAIEQGLTRFYPYGSERSARHRVCCRGVGGGANRRPAARAAGFPHRQERRREVPR